MKMNENDIQTILNFYIDNNSYDMWANRYYYLIKSAFLSLENHMSLYDFLKIEHNILTINKLYEIYLETNSQHLLKYFISLPDGPSTETLLKKDVNFQFTEKSMENHGFVSMQHTNYKLYKANIVFENRISNIIFSFYKKDKSLYHLDSLIKLYDINLNNLSKQETDILELNI